MRQSTLLNHRLALLAALGLIHGCGGRSEAIESRNEDTARLDASTDASDDFRSDDDDPRSDDEVDDDELPTDDTVADDPVDDDELPSDGDDGASDDARPLDDGVLLDDEVDDELPADDEVDDDQLPLDDDGASDDARPLDDGVLLDDELPADDEPISDDSDAGVDAGRTPLPPVGPVSLDCEGAQLPLGSGLQQCATGLVHRVDRPTCDDELPRDRELGSGIPESVLATDAGVPPVPFTLHDEDSDTYYIYECLSDDDCQERKLGMCEEFVLEPGPDQMSTCTYGCTTDDECARGYVCECGSPAGQCRPANCATDEDCDDDQVCARYQYDDGCGPEAGYACTHADDECRSDADCGDGYCTPGDDHRICLFNICEVGRPFLVAGAPRLAPAARSGDWLSGEAPRPTLAMSARAHQEIAEHWIEVGLMEHASIAAFARFALHLLAFAAPPSLIEATQQAMADETRHAQLAFDLASRFAQTPYGPGGLDLNRALEASGWEDVVLTTMLEGCIGETVAAMEAVEALQHARDPQVRATLQIIAGDERRHAELAWKFVDWALSHTPELAGPLRRLIDAELRRAVARATESATAATALGGPTSADGRAKLAHGVIPPELRCQLRASVLQTVVAPCADAVIKRAVDRATSAARTA
jgi:hypothetical protein